MDSRRQVRQVENATNQCAAVASSADRPSALGECKACGRPLGTRSGFLSDWDAFPAGVKFDPTDEELLQHLKAEIGLDNAKSHRLISNFISALDGEDGICQTHPEHLPGVKKDGSSRHFFHRPAKAYTTGTRKRRKIHSEDDEPGVETRWHKTGKTRPVSENGNIVGWKKIMVLYKNTGAKKSKPEKTNWILHQYHLGENEEESEGELVVCKVFYQKQPRQCTGGRQAEGPGTDVDLNQSSKDVSAACVSEVSRGTPVTPKVDAPQRPRLTNQVRGAPARSGKGSELTVLGVDNQRAGNSELTSTPLAPPQNGTSGGMVMSTLTHYSAAPKPMLQATTPPDYCGWNDPIVEEVSTSGKSCQNESNNQMGFSELLRDDEAHQMLPLESQPLYPDEDFDLLLHCNEDFHPDIYLPDLVLSDGLGYPEEPYVSNPYEDYPAVDEILTDTPPALNMDLILSSQEVMDHIYQRAVYTPLDNDDSLSST